MKKLFGYVRVSRVGGREGDDFIAPKVQRASIENWAKVHGHQILEVFEDLDQPGSKLNRPQLEAMMKRIKEGAGSGVVVARLDRFGRSVQHTAKLFEELEDANASLVSVSEGIDTATNGSMSVFLMNLFASLAQLELARISENWSSAKEGAVERGVYIAKAPLGYRKNSNKTLEPDEDAPLVVEMFKLRAQGKSWGEIAKASGKPLAAQSIRRIVRNRVYLGEVNVGDLVNTEAHEPLVDEATFQAAQVEHPRPPRGSLDQALLGGLVVCAGCSHQMTPTSRGGIRAYRCRRHHADGECPAPAHVGEWAEVYVAEEMSKLMQGRKYQARKTDEDLKAHESAVAKAEDELRTFQLASEGLDLSLLRDGLETRIEALRKAQEALENTRVQTDVLPDVKNWDEAWNSLSPEKKNQVLRAGLSAVIITKGRGVDPDRIRVVSR